MKKRSYKNRSDLRRFQEQQDRIEAAREAFVDSGIGDMTNSSYNLTVVFPLHVWNTTEDPTATLRRVAKAFGGKNIGSGGGMGMRDVEFGFRTLIEAIAFKSEMSRARNPFVHFNSVVVASSDGMDDGVYEQIEEDEAN